MLERAEEEEGRRGRKPELGAKEAKGEKLEMGL